MKTLLYSIHSFDKPFLEKEGDAKHELVFTAEALRMDTVGLAKGYEAVSLFSNDDASAPILKALFKIGVKYIALRSVGHDHVDLECAEQLGLKVVNVPEYSPYAIAEHGVAMLLMLNRHLYEAQLKIQTQDFRLDGLVGFDLKGKTVGIIGVGNIGYAFAKIMNGFGCKILAYDPIINKNLESIPIEYVSMNKLLSKSDIISLNCPLNKKTKYLIDDSEFDQMKEKVKG